MNDIEKAISHLGLLRYDCMYSGNKETVKLYDLALLALEKQLQEDKNEPLTLEELKQMDGQPVWIVTLENAEENPPYWAILGVNASWFDLYSALVDACGDYELYGKTWFAYRRLPKGADL